MDAQAAKKYGTVGDDSDLFQKLRPAKGSAPDGQKPRPPFEKGDGAAESGDGGEESVEGRKLVKVQNNKDPGPPKESQEDHELEVELNSILKRSPSTSLLPPLLFFCFHTQ
jgi:hypothetical protein